MDSESLAEINALVEEYRDRCLQFLQPEFLPKTENEAVITLALIERYGDKAARQRAGKIRKGLLRNSGVKS